MNSRARELTGVVVAPLIIPLIGIATGGSGAEGAWSLLGIFSSVIFSYFGMLVLGLPTIILLKRRGKYTLGWVVMAGMVGGVIVWVIFLELLGWLLGSTSAVSGFSVIAGAMFGLLVAFTYALIAGVRVGAQAI